MFPKIENRFCVGFCSNIKLFMGLRCAVKAVCLRCAVKAVTVDTTTKSVYNMAVKAETGDIAVCRFQADLP